ncbi:aminoglycoside phosphotransferase family protein [Lentzea sp. PSKA42]|uniref:Aminoglycoside phosphotransferase family protein n=1 Tax=Lentzea indica TaxID=2604800 RepID=A0ABX1FBE6_9PSEU|nr:aminoglycoside phosphotransferase family protein [Lentzea indica]NKE56032.1 aminoglycoside phosphotransferase family protein [Lentzea indica]
MERLKSGVRSRVWADGDRIVKQVIGDAAAFTREITALRLAEHTGVVPRVLDVDFDARTVVLERLRSEPPREDWVIDYARGLARLHSATGPEHAGALPRQEIPDPAPFLRFVRALDVEIGDAEDELAFEDTGKFDLLHGDPCPGNDLYTERGARFVDLEGAALGDGLTELVYLRIAFPTCALVNETPQELRKAAEQAYFEERGFVSPLEDACVRWLVQGDALVERANRDETDRLAQVVGQDWRWGNATARGRLMYRTRVVAEFTETHPRVSRLARRLHDRMAKLWGGYAIPAWRTHRS